MTHETSDADFTARLAARTPSVTPSPAFEAALLAAYDGWQAHRSRGLFAALRGGLTGFADLVWPGAPAWATAGVLAASLLVGVTLGATLPAEADTQSAFSLERAPGFSFLSADSEEGL